MIKKIFVSVLFLSLFISPMSVFAVSSTSASNSYANYSEEQLVTLIAKLQKQLEEVRKNKIQCNITEMDLSLGDGEEATEKEYVKNLQNFLKEKGYFTYTATGYFGKLTRAAIVSFQKASGLSQSGILDVKTRNFLKTLKCKKSYVIDQITHDEDNESENTGSVSSIALSGSGSAVSWVATGYSNSGFKIIWSKNSNPTYPTRDGDKYIYLSSASAVSTNLDAFSGSGTYYVRVCEYLGGTCGKYSNQITVSL